MDTMDVSSGLWPLDVKPELQDGLREWEAGSLDVYPSLLEENLSDSDSSLESPSCGLYFNPVNVDNQSGIGLESYGVSSEDQQASDIPFGWTYEIQGHSQMATSPGSTVTDSETASYHGHFVAMGDSSDEASQLFEEDDSTEDSEESYSSGTTATTRSNSSIHSPVDFQSPSQVSTRPSRSQPRGEHLKQVQEMIRQVNSALDPPTKAAKTKYTPNPKKRSRVEPDIRSVTLTREQLLTMSSEELDQFTARLKADHPLTAHEMREIKRQRRLIKNREYAQASRVKKKVVLSDLGSKFQELESERTQLIQRVLILETENANFRSQLGLPPSDRKPLNFLPNTQSNSNAAITDHAALESEPKAKRPRGRNTRNGTMAAIGGGLSLFAIVLFALAVYSGAHAQLPFGFGTFTPSPAAPSTASQAAAMNFQSTDAFNTFRTMDILATPQTDPTDNPDQFPSLPDDPRLQSPSSMPIDSPNTFTSNIVTMDELMASEEIIFATNNFSAPMEAVTEP